MIDYLQAQQMILERVTPRHILRLPLFAARNLSLAEDVRTPFPLPRFDHSAVDGYAIRAADTITASMLNTVTLNVTSEVRTGFAPEQSVTTGTAVKIFTGAMLPDGADTVVMLEDVQRTGSAIRLSLPVPVNKNIRRAGEEFSAGDVCMQAEQKLTPPALSLLAALGLESVPVHTAPRIALIVTGSELVEPGQSLGPAQIYNSNRYGIEAALAELGLAVSLMFISGDNENELTTALSDALKDADVVVTSGGVSVGDVDYVKPALLTLGARIHFDQVAIKPGKPFVFSTLKDKFIFGLPGNPVSALVTYLLFVKPALARMMGQRNPPPQIEHCTLACDVTKKNTRTEFVRGRFVKNTTGRVVEPCRGQESHMLGGLVSADALIILDGEPRVLAAGEEVSVMPIEWT